MLLLMFTVACWAGGCPSWGGCGCYFGPPGCDYGWPGCYAGPYGYWGGPVVYPGWYGYTGYYGYDDGARTWFGEAAYAANPEPARVVVNLPEGAQFYIGDKAWSLDSATHSFETPKLQPGQTYEYTLKAQVTRDGRTVTQSQRVSVFAGKETVVTFDDAPTTQLTRR
jgi:uncharacterized protein (TIGR03000 family)